MSLTDQTKLNKSDFPSNSASAWLLFLIAFVAALLGLITTDSLFSSGMNIVAITLFCFFALTMLNDFRIERAKIVKVEEKQNLIGCVQSIVMHEPDSALLTDLDGEILFMNEAAKERFLPIEDTHLSAALS